MMHASFWFFREYFLHYWIPLRILYKIWESAYDTILRLAIAVLQWCHTLISDEIEQLRAEGNEPDSLLISQLKASEQAQEQLFKEYKDWEISYYQEHPMLYALFDIADRLQYSRVDYLKLLNLYHTSLENVEPRNPIHEEITTMEASLYQIF